MAERMNNRAVATGLEQSAGALAAFAAREMEERRPELVAGYGEGAFIHWKEMLTQVVRDLGAAVRVGKPAMIDARMSWHRWGFEARDVPVAELVEAFDCLRRVVKAELPEGAGEVIDPFFDAGREALTAKTPPPSSSLDAKIPEGRLALRYLDAVLTRDRREAREVVLNAARAAEITIPAIYTRVLVPALREVGRLWHLGKLTIAEEHHITSTTRSVMSVLCQMGERKAGMGRTLAAAAVAGDEHDVAVHVACDLMELEGWSCVALGADVPAPEVARAAAFFGAGVVLLSATQTTSLRAMEETIARLRHEFPESCPAIVVAGIALDGTGDLWRQMGADGRAADLETLSEALASVAR